MSNSVQPNVDQQEMTRLRDELEQAQTALKASNEEASRLAEDRERLIVQMAAQSRELQAAKTAFAHLVTDRKASTGPILTQARESQADDELRVAFEELQVLTEELEVANNSLHATNGMLDRRVQERTLELELKNIALVQSELRFRTLVEGMPQLVWRSAHGGEWTWSSPQWTQYTGLSSQESQGLGWVRACHPDDRAAAQEAWELADTRYAVEYQARIFHVGEGRYRHHRTRAAPVRTETGDVVEWLGTCTDVDDLLTLQEQQSILMAELQHRTRNLMGMVQSTLKRTLHGSGTLEDFSQKIFERMGALARVQSILSRRGEGQRVAFETILREEIAVHVVLNSEGQGDQVAITGPSDVLLYSFTVQTLALGLHELMTNAVKYGAFATSDGRLDVTWSVLNTSADKRRLRIDWRESKVGNMPDQTDAPVGSGYGRELIERALPYQLGAETTYVLGHDGVRCTIEVDIA